MTRHARPIGKRAATRGATRVNAVLGIAVTAGMALAVVFAVLRARAHRSSPPTPVTAASAERVLDSLLGAGPGEPSSPERSAPKRIAPAATLAEAIESARPKFANTVGKLDVGSALLAAWASERLTWDALQALPETSPALFRKDPEAERGKRLCATGTILQIRAEKSLSRRLAEDRAEPLIERRPNYDSLSPSLGGSGSPVSDLADGPGLSEDWTLPEGGKLYFAILLVRPPGGSADVLIRPGAAALKDHLVVQVIAGRSTGALVDGSEGTACGVLTGVTLPPTDARLGSLGETPQHRIVGLFDLPENRARAEAK